MILNILDRFLRLVQPVHLNLDPLVGGAISIGSSIASNLFGGDDEIDIPDRDIRNEIQSGLAIREDFTEDSLDLENDIRRGVAGIDLNTIGDVLFRGSDNLGTFIPKLARESADLREELDTRSRGALLDDVNRFGPGFRDAIRRTNPELFDLINTQESRVLGDLGPSEISKKIADERARRVGRGLSAREKSNLTENVRKGFNDRGLLRNNEALLREAIGLTEADTNRLITNEELALAADRDLRSQRAEDDNRLGRLIGTRQATFFNPISTIAGVRSPDALGTGQRLGVASGIASSAQSGLTASPLIDPHIQNIFNDQFSAAVGGAVGQAEIGAARNQGISGTLGQAGIELLKKVEF